MRLNFRGRRARCALLGFLVLALVLRAFIPAGYMPSAERPFTLQICPDGFPVELLTAAHQLDGAGHALHGNAHGLADAAHGSLIRPLRSHAGHGSGPANHDSEPADQGQPASGGSHHDSFRSMHCVFAAVASAAPPQFHGIAVLAPPSSAVAPDPTTPHFQAPRFRTQQPRAPPALS